MLSTFGSLSAIGLGAAGAACATPQASSAAAARRFRDESLVFFTNGPFMWRKFEWLHPFGATRLRQRRNCAKRTARIAAPGPIPA